MLSAAGEALQMLPPMRAGVLDLHAADLARGLAQAGQHRREIAADEIAPAGEGTEPPVPVLATQAAQRLEAGDVEHVEVGRAADQGRVDVGAAGQDRERPLRQRCERLVELGGPEIEGVHRGRDPRVRLPCQAAGAGELAAIR